MLKIIIIFMSIITIIINDHCPHYNPILHKSLHLHGHHHSTTVTTTEFLLSTTATTSSRRFLPALWRVLSSINRVLERENQESELVGVLRGSLRSRVFREKGSERSWGGKGMMWEGRQWGFVLRVAGGKDGREGQGRLTLWEGRAGRERRRRILIGTLFSNFLVPGGKGRTLQTPRK